ncbi:hypothetical protein EDD85DRAFT_520396 [Armillaria nabsnona]|nr:hypothetical protein EDD85DRAFT_520396 [Armillaria nabsnona]
MPPPKSKGGKMLSLINWRLKVTINDGRALTGQMLAFDRHMNLVLADCEEFRRVRTKKKDAGEAGPGQEQEVKRTLGLVILRGETVVSISVEGPPPVVDEDKKNALPVGPGRGMPAGRGMGMMPPSAYLHFFPTCSLIMAILQLVSRLCAHQWASLLGACRVPRQDSDPPASLLVCLSPLLDSPVLLLASNRPSSLVV